MRKFVDVMASRGLAVVTVNERFAQIKSLFKVAKGKGLLPVNPAVDTLGLKQNSFEKRETRRLPFDNADLSNIFHRQYSISSNCARKAKRARAVTGFQSLCTTPVRGRKKLLGWLLPMW